MSRRILSPGEASQWPSRDLKAIASRASLSGSPLVNRQLYQLPFETFPI
jgi:hypothetical protein